MARILLVEDDPALARGLAASLAESGFVVDCVPDGETALVAAADQPYALIALDLGLPDLSGYDVLSALRRSGSKVPVLILTARDALADRLRGLDLGADDYLLKPFDPAELIARIRAILRRSQGEATSIVQLGSLTFDQARCVAHVNGRLLDLRRREWLVLERLVAKAGRVVSKDRLCSEVFSYDEPVALNAIEVYVARLRRKLQPDGPLIRTVRGLGYLLEAT